jgi:hypothetical protein
MSDGVKGGDVNRPGSGPEIRKLPQYRCERCLFEGPRTMVGSTTQGPRCVNTAACDRRLARRATKAARRSNP